MGCFAPDAPKPVNYGQQTRDTLQAQIDLAPQQFASEQQFQPGYTNLALQQLNSLLNGSAGGTQSINYSNPVSKAGWYDANGNFVGGDQGQYTTSGTSGAGGLAGTGHGVQTIPQGVRWIGNGGMLNGTRDMTTSAQPGLFALLRQQATDQRTGDINDVANLGLSAHDAMLASNPEQATLMAKLNAQANSGLDAGSNLTPDEARAMQQSSRAAFAARGMGGGNGAISDELLRQFDLGQQLLRQRQAFAQSMVGTNKSIVGDPFMQILGRNSGAIQSAQQTGAQSGPSLFNPESPLSAQISAGNQAYQAMFADPSTMSKVGAISNMAGSFIGSVAGGMI